MRKIKNNGSIVHATSAKGRTIPANARLSRAALAAALASVGGMTPALLAAPNASGDHAWLPVGGGSWGTLTNWTNTPPAGGPSGIGIFVSLNSNVTSTSTITLFNTGDAGSPIKTLGRLDLGDANNTHSFAVAAGSGLGSITFDGNGSAALLNQLGTSKGDAINARMGLATGLDVANASGNTLTLFGGFSSTATSGTQTIRVNSAGAGNTNFNGVLSDGASGGKLAFVLDGGLASLSNPSGTATAFASGATTLTLSANPGVIVGNTITGTGIAVGTTVAAINGNQITLSQATTSAQAGTSTLTFNHTYSGGVTVNAGTLNIGNGTALGTGALIINGGRLNGQSGNQSVTNATTVNGSFAYGTATSSLNLNGAANLGTAAGTSRTITVDGTGALAFGATSGAGGVISNGTTATRLIKAGSGTLHLNNQENTFTNLTVDDGQVGYFGSVAGTLSTNFAAPTDIGTPFGTGDITLDGGTLAFTFGTNASNQTYVELKNNLVLTSDSTLIPGGGQRRNAVVSGLISGDGQLALKLGNGNSGQQTSVTLTRANNTYAAGTALDVTSNTTGVNVQFVAGAVNALGGGAGGTGGVVSFINSGNVASQNNGLLVLKADQRIAGLTNTNAGSADFVTGFSTSTATTLTINNTLGQAGDGSTYSGAIGGAPLAVAGITGTAAAGNNINLRKVGTGSQTLTGASTYTGVTTIDGGKLVVGVGGIGSLAGTLVTVNAGGTLGGSGSIATGSTTGGVDVKAGGTLAAGNSVGTLSVRALALQADANVEVEFNATANDLVEIIASDGFAINGGKVWLFSEGTTNLPSLAEGSYALFKYAGGLSGSVDNLLVANDDLTDATAYSFATSSESGANYVNLVVSAAAAVPEPGAIAVLVATGGIALCRRRRV